MQPREEEGKEEEEQQQDDNVAWVNAVLGRVCWDFLGEPYWAELVSKKIQMKLSKIRVSEAWLLITFHFHSPFTHIFFFFLNSRTR